MYAGTEIGPVFVVFVVFGVLALAFVVVIARRAYVTTSKNGGTPKNRRNRWGGSGPGAGLFVGHSGGTDGDGFNGDIGHRDGGNGHSCGGSSCSSGSSCGSSCGGGGGCGSS